MGGLETPRQIAQRIALHNQQKTSSSRPSSAAHGHGNPDNYHTNHNSNNHSALVLSAAALSMMQQTVSKRPDDNLDYAKDVALRMAALLQIQAGGSIHTILKMHSLPSIAPSTPLSQQPVTPL